MGKNNGKKTSRIRCKNACSNSAISRIRSAVNKSLRITIVNVKRKLLECSAKIQKGSITTKHRRAEFKPAFETFRTNRRIDVGTRSKKTIRIVEWAADLNRNTIRMP